jgi:hypothetical protein
MNYFSGNLDAASTVAMAISTFYGAWYTAFYFGLYIHVTNLAEIQEHAINKIGSKNGALKLFDLIRKIREENQCLLWYPERKNYYLDVSSIFFLIISIAYIFYPLLPARYELFSTEIRILLLYCYIPLLLFSVYFLFKDTKYFLQLFRIQKKYPPKSAE